MAQNGPRMCSPVSPRPSDTEPVLVSLRFSASVPPSLRLWPSSFLFLFRFPRCDRSGATLRTPPRNTHRHRESFTLPDYPSIDLPPRTCTFVLGDIETSGFAIIYSYPRTFRPSFLRQAQPLSIEASYLRSVNATVRVTHPTKSSTPPRSCQFYIEIPASRYVLSPQRCNDFLTGSRVPRNLPRGFTISTAYRSIRPVSIIGKIPDRPWHYR